MKIALAEALLRRKELGQKVEQLQNIRATALFETKAQRKKVTEDLDDIIAQVPKLTAEQVTAEYDFYARQLRLIDAAIQRANWETQIEVNEGATQSWGEAMKISLERNANKAEAGSAAPGAV